MEFIDGLRARRLFDLAAHHCRDQLSKSDIDPLREAELTGQLIRIHGEQALHAAPEQRAGSWKAAHDVAAEFVAKHQQHPRLAVVRAQDAFVWRAEGELLRQEAEMTRAGAAERFTIALDVLRTAARALEQLDTNLGSALPAAPRVAEGAELSADELLALRNHVRLELARVYRNRGLCYPEGDDRIAAFAQALEPLEAALSQLPAEDPLSWQARLERAVCLRVMGSRVEARNLLNSLAVAEAPARLAPAIRAEEIRFALAESQIELAMNKATQQLPPGAEDDPDFALARLEAIIAQWQQASSTSGAQAARWRSQAVELTRFIEQQHGGYWGRRAEQQLLQSAAGGSGAGDVEILRRRADDLYRQNRLPDAVAAYDEAADAAANAGLAEEEFLCRFRAALVVQLQDDAPAALERFRQLALKLPSHEQASAAHFEAIKVAVELARENGEAMQLYEQLLLEHLQHWAAGATADQARMWLGRLYRHGRRFTEALAVYATIAPNSSHFVDGAIATAHVLLEFAPERAGEALPLLEQASARVAAADAAVRDEIESLMIAALAVDPARAGEAAVRLNSWKAQDPALVMSLADRLSQISENLPAEQQRMLANLQLQLVARLRPTAGDEQSLTNIQRMEAFALASAGETQRALAAFRDLAERLPRDGRVQLEYARLLESGGNAASWNAALTQWSNIALHSPKQSDAWYEAKLGVARARLELGNAEQAADLVQYLLATSPPPDGSKWAIALREFLARVQ